MGSDDMFSTFDAFRPHFDALARVAYFKVVRKPLSPIKYAIHNIYRSIVWVLVVTYNLQHIIRVYEVRHDADRIVDILFILFTTLNTLSKQVAFNARSQRIDHIIDVIAGPVFATKKSYHVKVAKENAVMMHRLLKFYIGSIFTCGTLWTIFPLVNKALGVEVEFTASFPFDTSTSPSFELTVAYMSILITFQAYGNVTMDCTIVSFYAQVKVQLQILRHNLEHLADKDDDGHLAQTGRNLESVVTREKKVQEKENNKEFERVVQSRLVSCVVHHLQILWFVKEIESIFAEALLFQFFVTAWVICMTVYKIVGLSLFSAEFLSMAMYLCCILAQFYIYCYYGTQVKYESELLNQSTYCADWMCLSPGFRRQLLVAMVNCSRPITPRTAYIIPISLETYIAVIRASYTLYTFLDRK